MEPSGFQCFGQLGGDLTTPDTTHGTANRTAEKRPGVVWGVN